MGTRITSITGYNLQELEATINSWPYEVKHAATLLRPNGEWVIQYILPDRIILAAQNESGTASAQDSSEKIKQLKKIKKQ
jgi:hypothetical protein